MSGNVHSRREFIRTSLVAIFSLATAPFRSRAEEDLRYPACSPGATRSLNTEIIPRAAWTDFMPRVIRMRPSNGFEKITIHHRGCFVDCSTDMKEVIRRLDGVLTSHLQRNYGDVGYHFIIDYAGRVWEGRSLDFEGAHVAGHNWSNIGIMLLGNFEEQEPSSEQVSSAKVLCAALCGRYGISPERIYGHRDLAYSLCPGEHLYTHVMEMRRSVTAELTGLGARMVTKGGRDNDIERHNQSPS